MSTDTQQIAVLENIVPQLEAEGFEVFANPSSHLLPPFMQTYRPDAIALRKDRNLAIEVLRKGVNSEKKLETLRALLSGHRDWELRVYWVSQSSTPSPLEAASRKDIERAIKSVDELAAEGFVAPAFLLAWATLEALGRALLPQKFPRPQTPARLLEVLATDGLIAPSEADRLRQLAGVRNRLVHGELQSEISTKDLKVLSMVLKDLRKLVASG